MRRRDRIRRLISTRRVNRARACALTLFTVSATALSVKVNEIWDRAAGITSCSLFDVATARLVIQRGRVPRIPGATCCHCTLSCVHATFHRLRTRTRHSPYVNVGCYSFLSLLSGCLLEYLESSSRPHLFYS